LLFCAHLTLADHGHRQIAYVREEPWSAAGEIQLAGMRDTARHLALPPSAIVVPTERTRPWGDAAAAAYERTCALLAGRKPPTAFVYDTLSGAHAGMRALSEAGLRVPEGISVLTSAPDHPYARYDWPRIGGVAAPPGALVERAVDLLLHPPSTPVCWIDPVVDPRESVAAPPAPRRREIRRKAIPRAE